VFGWISFLGGSPGRLGAENAGRRPGRGDGIPPAQKIFRAATVRSLRRRWNRPLKTCPMAALHRSFRSSRGYNSPSVPSGFLRSGFLASPGWQTSDMGALCFAIGGFGFFSGACGPIHQSIVLKALGKRWFAKPASRQVPGESRTSLRGVSFFPPARRSSQWSSRLSTTEVSAGSLVVSPVMNPIGANRRGGALRHPGRLRTVACGIDL